MAWSQGSSGAAPKASTFAVACTLLSQYVKGTADFGLSAAPHAGELEAAKSTKMTLSLLPGVDVEDSMKKLNIREPEKAPLTIFYAGKVLAFDDFPAEKAKDLMNFAGKGTENLQNFGYVAPSLATAVKVECQNDPVDQDVQMWPAPVNTSVAAQAQPQPQGSAQQKNSELPIARKASLSRFLVRRKDRINARAPYQSTGSSEKATQKSEESKSWLGLSPQVSEHALDQSTNCSR